MKYYKRLGIFKASNVSFNSGTKEAYSYGWWKFVSKIKGEVVFNSYSYSPTTLRHQSKVRQLMGELGIPIDRYVRIKEGLQSLRGALQPLYVRKFELEIQISRGRANSMAQRWRLIELLEVKEQIQWLRSLGYKFSRNDIRIVKDSIETAAIVGLLYKEAAKSEVVIDF